MDLERFVLLNVVLVPAIVIAIRRYLDAIPLVVYVIAIGYVTFAGFLSVAWVLSRASMARDGS